MEGFNELFTNSRILKYMGYLEFSNLHDQAKCAVGLEDDRKTRILHIVLPGREFAKISIC